MNNKPFFNGKDGHACYDTVYNSVEIYFNRAPDRDMLSALKVLGWRYHNKKKCWYNRNNSENVQLAKSVLGEQIVEQQANNRYTRIIGTANLLVVTTLMSCIHLEHHLERAIGLINVLKNSRLYEIELPVLYCKECDTYYIRDIDFNSAKKSGILCCQILTRDVYANLNGIYELKPQSELRSFGYTTNAKDGYTTRERQDLLAFLIENKLMEASRIEEYLTWFIKLNHESIYKQSSVSKWREDLNFVRKYTPGNRTIRVRAIFDVNKIKK